MDQVEPLLTHVKKVEIRVESVDVGSQIGVQCDATINGWIAAYGLDFSVIIQNCLNVVCSKLFPRLLPLENVIASVGSFGVPSRR